MTSGDDASGPSCPADQPESGPNQESSKTDTLQVENPPSPLPDGMSSQRVFKKVSPNQKLTLYLSSRDLVVSAAGIDKLQGVLLVDPEFVEDRRVFGQVTLTFRYGREDEEVMGLKFCNEAIMCLAQLYPPHPAQMEGVTPLQEALIRRLGPNAYPFSLEITPLAPPSVQLVPAKEYNGAPIGTSYDVRAYVDKADEKLHRRSTVRMGIRVVQKAFAPPSPDLYVPGGTGKTCRDKAKFNKKTLLFGCKSVPVQIKNPAIENDQVISRSAETVANTETSINDKNWLHVHKTGVFADPTIFQNTTSLTVPSPTFTQVRRKSILKLGENPDVERCGSPGKVSFEGGKMVNGDTQDDQQHHHEEDRENDTGGDKGIDKTDEEDRHIAEQYRSLCGSQRPSLAAFLAEVPAPKAVAEKFYMLSDGKVTLTATLDKAIYAHGDDIKVTVNIRNDSSKTVKRIKMFVVQHVDVCMFSNGKFKNVVAMMTPKEDCPVHAGTNFEKTYTMMPMKSSTKNWIALEESYNRSGTSLASTVVSVTNPDDRNVFAIYVSYYVKVKITVSLMGGELSLKLPFTLMHTCAEHELAEAVASAALRGGTIPEVGGAKIAVEAEPEKQGGDADAEDGIKPEKDGT